MHCIDLHLLLGRVFWELRAFRNHHSFNLRLLSIPCKFAQFYHLPAIYLKTRQTHLSITMSCPSTFCAPTKSYELDHSEYNNVCMVGMSVNTTIATALANCCTTTGLPITNNECYSYCNFTSIAVETTLTNCFKKSLFQLGLTTDVGLDVDCVGDLNTGITKGENTTGTVNTTSTPTPSQTPIQVNKASTRKSLSAIAIAGLVFTVLLL